LFNDISGLRLLLAYSVHLVVSFHHHHHPSTWPITVWCQRFQCLPTNLLPFGCNG